MLRNKLGSLRRELKKIGESRDKKFFIAYVDDKKDRAVVEMETKVVFDGKFSEYQAWLKGKGDIIIQDNFLIEMDWGLRGPVMDWESVKSELTF
jgi:hypothetical protein